MLQHEPKHSHLRETRKEGQNEDPWRTPGSVVPAPTPRTGQATQHCDPCLPPGPFPFLVTPGRAPATSVLTKAPRSWPEPEPSFSAATPLGWDPSLATFLGCCCIDYFGSLFAGDINLVGSRDGCVLTSHPGLDSVSSRCPWARRRWRAPGLAGKPWSRRISRNRGWDRLAAPQPRNLPPFKPAGELLKMQFPFIFPVKSLPVP